MTVTSNTSKPDSCSLRNGALLRARRLKRAADKQTRDILRLAARLQRQREAKEPKPAPVVVVPTGIDAAAVYREEKAKAAPRRNAQFDDVKAAYQRVLDREAQERVGGRPRRIQRDLRSDPADALLNRLGPYGYQG